MKQKLIATFVAVLFIAASSFVTYLIGTCVTWELNPVEWNQKGQALAVFTGCILPLMINGVLVLTFYNDWDLDFFS